MKNHFTILLVVAVMLIALAFTGIFIWQFVDVQSTDIYGKSVVGPAGTAGKDERIVPVAQDSTDGVLTTSGTYRLIPGSDGIQLKFPDPPSGVEVYDVVVPNELPEWNIQFTNPVTTYTIARDPDGNSYMINPSGTLVNGSAFSSAILKFSATGRADTSFVVTVTGGTISRLVFRDQLYVAGSFTNVNGSAVSRLCRLQANGALDSSWIPNATAGITINGLAVTDTDVVVGGNFTSTETISTSQLARFYDGNRDPNFTGTMPSQTFSQVWKMYYDAIDNFIYVWGTWRSEASTYTASDGNESTIRGQLFTRTRIRRFNATTGVMDATWVPLVHYRRAAPRTCYMFRKGAYVYIAGAIMRIDANTAVRHVARLSVSNGTWDSSWNPLATAASSFFGGSPYEDWCGVHLDPNQNFIYLAGCFATVSGSSYGGLCRYALASNDTLTFDASWKSSLIGQTYANCVFESIIDSDRYLLMILESRMVYLALDDPSVVFDVSGLTITTEYQGFNRFLKSGQTVYFGEAVGSGRFYRFNQRTPVDTGVLIPATGRFEIDSDVGLVYAGNVMYDLGNGGSRTITTGSTQAYGWGVVPGTGITYVWLDPLVSATIPRYVGLIRISKTSATTITRSYNFSNVVNAVTSDSSDRVYVAGMFRREGVTLSSKLARLNAQGDAEALGTHPVSFFPLSLAVDSKAVYTGHITGMRSVDLNTGVSMDVWSDGRRYDAVVGEDEVVAGHNSAGSLLRVNDDVWDSVLWIQPLRAKTWLIQRGDAAQTGKFSMVPMQLSVRSDSSRLWFAGNYRFTPPAENESTWNVSFSV